MVKGVREEYVKRGQFIDVGIAEENMVAMSSGVAKNGGTVVFGTFAPFLQRTYDQISHDLCLNDSPATMLVLQPGVYGMNSNTHIALCDIQLFRETSKWLDIYFSGKVPNFIPKYKIANLTSFRQEVIDIMNSIEFGETLTYNDIAKIIAKKRELKRMSAQAVGGAVGWNPICIIIPCHRVVGTNGSLTGYGGGIKNKVALLTHENNNMNKYFVPKRGTAL